MSPHDVHGPCLRPASGTGHATQPAAIFFFGWFFSPEKKNCPTNDEVYCSVIMPSVFVKAWGQTNTHATCVPLCGCSDAVNTGDTPGRQRRCAVRGTRVMTGQDRFLLCNLVIRLGLSVACLAGLFGVSESSTSRHLFTGVWTWKFWVAARFKPTCDAHCGEECAGQHYNKERAQHRMPPSHQRRFKLRVFGLLDAHPVCCGKSSNRDWVRATYNK